jgi:hypothetical protein
MRNNKICLFHVVIIPCIVVFLLLGCGFKGDPKYMSDVKTSEVSNS